MSGRVLVELCAGTAAVSLWALGRCAPITGYMGSKRRWAALLTEVLDVDRPDRVVLVDAGPWGEVWSILRDARARERIAQVFDALGPVGTPNKLWCAFASVRPPPDPIARTVQYLWLQARSAGTIPMWWSEERDRWESPSGSRTEIAHQTRPGVAALGRVAGARRRRTADIPACHQGNERELGPAYPARDDGQGARALGPAHDRGALRGARAGAVNGKPDHRGARGIQHPATIARRLRALDRIDWSRVEVFHGDARALEALPGAAVLFDPPYLGAPRYAALLPRADVLEVAERWRRGGGRVLVCESEPLPLPGWTSRRLPAVRRGEAPHEWVTASFVPRGLPEQLCLPGVAA